MSSISFVSHVTHHLSSHLYPLAGSWVGEILPKGRSRQNGARLAADDALLALEGCDRATVDQQVQGACEIGHGGGER